MIGAGGTPDYLNRMAQQGLGYPFWGRFTVVLEVVDAQAAMLALKHEGFATADIYHATLRHQIIVATHTNGTTLILIQAPESLTGEQQTPQTKTFTMPAQGGQVMINDPAPGQLMWSESTATKQAPEYERELKPEGNTMSNDEAAAAWEERNAR